MAYSKTGIYLLICTLVNRQVDESVPTSIIEGVEHLGQHVFAMMEKALAQKGLKES